MKTITLIATEYGTDNHGLGNHVMGFNITVRNNNWTETDILSAIQSAAKEYCLTGDDKKVYDGNCRCFNIGDFVNYVPSGILNENGIYSITDVNTMSIDFNKQLVDGEDIFPIE